MYCAKTTAEIDIPFDVTKCRLNKMLEKLLKLTQLSPREPSRVRLNPGYAIEAYHYHQQCGQFRWRIANSAPADAHWRIQKLEKAGGIASTVAQAYNGRLGSKTPTRSKGKALIMDQVTTPPKNESVLSVIWYSIFYIAYLF